MSEEGPPPELTPEQEALLVEARRIEKLFRFRYGHRVRYDEIDAQGVVGSGSWLDLLHLARVEYLRRLGLLLEGGRAPVQVMVRRASIEFLAPARFDEVVVLCVRVSQLGNTSARFEYLCETAEGLRLAVAETVVACVEVARQRAVAWPVVFRERVAEFEGDGLSVGQIIR